MKRILMMAPASGAVAALLFVLAPFIALLPLGVVWLLQNDWLLIWVVLSGLMATCAIWVFKRWRKSVSEHYVPPEVPVDAAWAPHDVQAWNTVQDFAKRVDIEVLRDPGKLTTLSRQVFETVASHYRKNDPRAVWGFTVPEALLLTERLARKIRQRILTSVPLGEWIEVRQVLLVLGWKPYLDGALKAWRVARLVNPAEAAASEFRTRVTNAVLKPIGEEAQKRIAAIVVEEVGRAAIDLYGGHLRLSEEELAQLAMLSAKENAQLANPLRVVVAGQGNTGKSSLINALSDEVRAEVDVLPATEECRGYKIERDGVHLATFVDTPGLTGDEKLTRKVIEEAVSSDLVIWVVAGNRPARAIDKQAREQFKTYFAARAERRMPPIVVVVSHVDRLRPFGEWKPPYDLQDASSRKAENIREAVAACCEELRIEVDEAVPTCLSSEVGYYNIDALWAQIDHVLPMAKMAQLNRINREGRKFSWSQLRDQAIGAGRVLGQIATAKGKRSADLAPPAEID